MGSPLVQLHRLKVPSTQNDIAPLSIFSVNFMKRIFIIILTLSLLLCSCGEKEVSFGDITDTALLKQYYGGETITDWRVIAALYLEGADISAHRIFLYEGDSVYETAASAISAAILTQLFEAEGYDTEKYVTPLLEAVSEPDEIPTLDLCMALMAFYVCGTEVENLDDILTYLADIQLADGGWGEDADARSCDAYVSAMVLNVITAYREEYDDNESRDGLLTYLGSCIENDNTVLDSEGESSSLATMGVLNSLVFAGIPANGEISTALCTAMGDFSAGGTYSLYREGEHDDSATAEVFLAFATARRASIFYFFSDEYKDMINESK